MSICMYIYMGLPPDKGGMAIFIISKHHLWSTEFWE